jgi:hypothetical protein
MTELLGKMTTKNLISNSKWLLVISSTLREHHRQGQGVDQINGSQQHHHVSSNLDFDTFLENSSFMEKSNEMTARTVVVKQEPLPLSPVKIFDNSTSIDEDSMLAKIGKDEVSLPMISINVKVDENVDPL